MADFCLQCSESLFGPDTCDFVGLLKKEQVEQGLGVNVLCEGCGPAWVDHEGRCMAINCLEKHGEKKHGS